ncbi:uncharacterized protein LOC127799778 [Diospyros lotus]|uniref:uncharacterized protein LOC127799778 n=1 Tax=Diospyros lotus TaxID=55363 RepID=UPI0022501752|nr:uncharacterized protein LOC127799778 [Diospyros lotus]
MELEDVESDLKALRRLYWLLQSSGNGLQRANAECLDEKARIFLKGLLDSATERVFGAHSKLKAIQLWFCDALPAGKLGKLKGVPIQGPVSPDAPETSLGIGQISAKAPIRNQITLHEENKMQIMPPTQEISSEKSKLDSFATGPEKTKGHCRIFQNSNLECQKSTEEGKGSDWKNLNRNVDITSYQYQQPNQYSWFYGGKRLGLDKQNTSVSGTGSQQNKGVEKIRRNPSGLGPWIAMSSCVPDLGGEIEQKPDYGDYISKEVADAIRQIELRILDVHMARKHVSTFDKLNFASKQVSQRVWESNNSRQVPQVLSQDVKPGSLGNDVMSQMVNHNMMNHTETEFPSQIASRASEVLPPKNGVLSQLVSEDIVRNSSPMLLNKFSGHEGNNVVSNGDGKSIRRTSQVIGQNVKAIVEKFDSRLPSLNDNTSGCAHKSVRGLRLPAVPATIVSTIPAFQSNIPSKIDKEIMPQNERFRMVETSQSSSKLTVSLESKDVSNQTIQMEGGGQRKKGTWTMSTTHGKKDLPHQNSIQSKVPEISYGNQLDQEKSGLCKSNKLGTQRKKLFPYQQEPEDTSSSSHNSSSSMNQQSSTGGSEDEAFLSPSQTRGCHYMDPSRSTNRDSDQSRSAQTEGSNLGLTSTSESEGYASSSGSWSHHTGSTRSYSHSINPVNSIDYDGYPPSDQVTSTNTGSTRNSRSGNRLKPKDRIGRLRKLKNKLALILHHHHHHHHYHHHHDNGHNEQKIKVRHGMPLWKSSRKVFQGTGRGEAYGERAAQKLTKLQGKNQRGHLMKSLVERLLRHVRNSRKTKLPKCIRQGRDGHKVIKKLHWWQMFRRKRAMKLPRKSHVKLGLGSKKSQLQSLPKMG